MLDERRLVNYGQGFDSRSGEFTATIPGLYYLRASLASENVFDVNMMKNEMNICNMGVFGTHFDPESRKMSVCGTVQHLTRGDKVYIRMKEPYDIIHDASSFSGFLIVAD